MLRRWLRNFDEVHATSVGLTPIYYMKKVTKGDSSSLYYVVQHRLPVEANLLGYVLEQEVVVFTRKNG